MKRASGMRDSLSRREMLGLSAGLLAGTGLRRRQLQILERLDVSGHPATPV